MTKNYSLSELTKKPIQKKKKISRKFEDSIPGMILTVCAGFGAAYVMCLCSPLV